MASENNVCAGYAFSEGSFPRFFPGRLSRPMKSASNHALVLCVPFFVSLFRGDRPSPALCAHFFNGARICSGHCKKYGSNLILFDRCLGKTDCSGRCRIRGPSETSSSFPEETRSDFPRGAAKRRRRATAGVSPSDVSARTGFSSWQFGQK